MSYSYECNVICDGCKAVVCGELSEKHSKALSNASYRAIKEGWWVGIGWQYCPECKNKKRPSQTK